jgi:hypothetical protein
MKRKLEKTLPGIHFFAALRVANLQMLSSPYFELRYLGLSYVRVAMTN